MPHLHSVENPVYTFIFIINGGWCNTYSPFHSEGMGCWHLLHNTNPESNQDRNNQYHHKENIFSASYVSLVWRKRKKIFFFPLTIPQISQKCVFSFFEQMDKHLEGSLDIMLATDLGKVSLNLEITSPFIYLHHDTCYSLECVTL